MKKLFTVAIVSIAGFAANAQGATSPTYTYSYEPEVFRTFSILLLILLFMVFIVTLLKLFFENRLKNKIVDKGVSDTAAASILYTSPKNDRQSTIKWFCILAGLGAGLMIVNYTQPLGIHSIATLAFSLSASFLAYYFFTKNSNS